ncbi:hypothetical protein DS745_07265 [Anaerobacillus alkaliphilus]|uniref:SLH domain-containing protein n=1 Tax=Anaerobacillus alkaliphilus TaxID=1548597 RepID=A0A4Q0VV43_9BACI|nr:family 10 glycosylhydrolase [Anaerobacillus alkaliphilus]RXJ02186.1 hypothetical protein DS745_07265 [Anaerobacillus alkaliphilus]
MISRKFRKMINIMIIFVMMVGYLPMNATAEEFDEAEAEEQVEEVAITETLQAHVYQADGETIAYSLNLDLVNPDARQAGKFTLYTWEKGLHTKTEGYGVAVAIENGVVTQVIDGRNVVQDSMMIPGKGFVLYAWEPSTSAENPRGVLKDHFQVGKKVSLEGYEIPNLPEKAVVAATKEVIEVTGVNVARTENNAVVYTREHGSKTGTGDWGIEVVVSKNKVIEIVNGINHQFNNANIPVDGYVLSVRNADLRTKLLANFKVGDEIRLHGVTIPEVKEEKGVLLQNGTLIEVGQINGTRPAGTVVLYDAKHGLTTGTGDWGVEVVVENGVVKEVINALTNDTSRKNNAHIPINGYVLSAIDPSGSTTLRNQLANSFKVGDKVELLNIELPKPYGVVTPNNKRSLLSGVNVNRDADTLVLYTAAFGMTTKTGNWGVEVIVQDGIVTEIVNGATSEGNRNNSAIPINGYVLSAHGTKRAVLTDNFKVGDEVKLEGITLPPSVAAISNGENRVIITDNNRNRNADELILYTSDFGLTTGTGPWGVEIVVDGGEVIQVVNGLEGDHSNNAVIPMNGYVLSAIDRSGSMQLRNQLLNHFKVGDKVELQGFVYDPRTELTKVANAIDPTPENNPGGAIYDGYRGPNQLIVYTPQYGKKTTGTNIYGTEIVVVDGYIVDKGGYNKEIPENGFVVSGHGVARDWLNQNTVVGAKVEYDRETKEVKIIVDGEVYLRIAQIAYEEAKVSFDNAVTKFYDIDEAKAEAALEVVKQKLDHAKSVVETDELTGINLAREANVLAQKAYYLTIESIPVEGRGVWHRPMEKTLADVQKTLDKFQQANINLLYLETFYHGYVIYPSEVAEQRPEFAGVDILQMFIDEAKKRDIEVHLWVENFYVGHTTFTPNSPILAKNPHWEALNTKLERPSTREVGYIFMNPAHPEVRDFLSELYQEMITKYDVPGLQLDYIRYPNGGFGNDYSYDDYSRNVFKEEYGMDPLEIPSRDHEMKKKWDQWRQNNITTFVERIHRELKEINPDVALSTAIFPQVSDAINGKMQDWPLWVEKGYLDVIAPMAYYTSPQQVKDDVTFMHNLMENKTVNYAGIAPYLKLTPKDIVQQVIGVREAGAHGVVMFDSKSFFDDMLNALSDGPFRTKAIVPDTDVQKSVERMLENIQTKMETIYVARDAMTASEHEAVEKALAELLSVTDYTIDSELKKLEGKFQKLISEVGSLVANQEVTKRIQEDLEYTLYLVTYKRWNAFGQEPNQQDPGTNPPPVYNPTPSVKIEFSQADIQSRVKEGKVSLKVGNSVILPGNVGTLAEIVELENEFVKLEIPKEVLVSLGKLADGKIELSLEKVAKDSLKLSKEKHVTTKVAGDAVTLELFVKGQNGQTHKLTSFEKPVKITLAVDPNAKKKFVGVYYLGKDGSLEYQRGNIVEGTITATVSHFSTFAVLEYERVYTDVPTTHWAFQVIQELSAKHVVKGINDDQFAPTRNVTRAEFAALLVRALGLPEAKEAVSFADVAQTKWYSKEISAASAAGIVKGKGENKFAPEDLITREEMAVMIVRAYEYKTGKKAVASGAVSFNDAANVSSWAKEYVAIAAKLSLIQGNDGKFRPTEHANRAESAQVIFNLLQ